MTQAKARVRPDEITQHKLRRLARLRAKVKEFEILWGEVKDDLEHGVQVEDGSYRAELEQRVNPVGWKREYELLARRAGRNVGKEVAFAEGKPRSTHNKMRLEHVPRS